MYAYLIHVLFHMYMYNRTISMYRELHTWYCMQCSDVMYMYIYYTCQIMLPICTVICTCTCVLGVTYMYIVHVVIYAEHVHVARCK